MCRRGAEMPADLLEEHRADAAGGLVQLLEPGAEAQEHHAAALEPAGAELHRAAGDHAVGGAQRPAGVLAEVEGQDDSEGSEG